MNKTKIFCISLILISILGLGCIDDSKNEKSPSEVKPTQTTIPVRTVSTYVIPTKEVTNVTSINVTSSQTKTNTIENKNIEVNYSYSRQDSVGTTKAKEGNTYLIVTFNIKNNGYSQFKINPESLKMVINNKKYECSPDSQSLVNNLPETSIANGEHMIGAMAYYVPEDTNSFEIKYEEPGYNIIYKK